MGAGSSALLDGGADSAMLAAALEKRGQQAVSQEAPDRDSDSDDDSDFHPPGSLGARRGLQLALSQAAGSTGSAPVRLRGDTTMQTKGEDSTSGPLSPLSPSGRRRSFQIGQAQLDEEPVTPRSPIVLVDRRGRRASEPPCLWSNWSILEIVPEKLQSMPEDTPISPKKYRKMEISRRAAISIP
eukprot:TRINITY_DN5507_c0_g3_i1.p1 TRINITY_DN5507_c0_g3~~TRINITY_DN5507_c0_g3_i1.p1  ORF type:complete len:184 (-),score=30.76 TRINITY_DN5507_c0_g3_i1:14-565(-)